MGICDSEDIDAITYVCETKYRGEDRRLIITVAGNVKKIIIDSNSAEPESIYLYIYFRFNKGTIMPDFVFEDPESYHKMTLDFTYLEGGDQKEINRFLDNLPIGLKRLELRMTIYSIDTNYVKGVEYIEKLIKKFPECGEGEYLICVNENSAEPGAIPMFRIENFPSTLKSVFLDVVGTYKSPAGYKIPYVLSVKSILEYFVLGNIDVDVRIGGYYVYCKKAEEK